MNQRISIVMTVVERPIQLSWCLHHLRSVYKDVAITTISDGSRYHEYKEICSRYSARYVEGERLKISSMGGKWWARTLMYGLDSDSDFILKIDPDTKFQRSIQVFPNFDISGTLSFKGRPIEHVQGGVQMFARPAVETLINSRFFSQTKLVNPKSYAWDRNLLSFALRNNYLCTDAMLKLAKSELGLTWGDWQEVCSHWKKLPSNHEKYAITHPHKWQNFPK